jgi:hypothetical protein
VVLAVAHPPAAVGVFVGNAVTVFVEECHAGQVVGEVVGAQNPDVDARLALAQDALVAAEGGSPERIEL